MRSPLIQIKDLEKKFCLKKFGLKSFDALQDINLNIYPKDIFGIIGMSGAGKSTLMRCLTGLERSTRGSILFDNQLINPQTFKQLSHEVGMIFQQFHLFSSRTVYRNIAFPLEIQFVDEEEQKVRIHELLKLVGLESKKNFYPAQLSGGEKQRVGIARALATKPRLLFCDEPTSALDSKTSHSILQLLLDLNHQLGLTIVMITHQLEAVKQICNRMAVLSEGKIVEQGETQQLFTQPQHNMTRELLQIGIFNQFLTKEEQNSG